MRLPGLFLTGATLHFVPSVLGTVLSLRAAFDIQAGWRPAPGEAALAWRSLLEALKTHSRRLSRRCARSIVLALGILALAPTVADAVECTGRFPEGRFGIAPLHPALADVAVPGFSPLYLVKKTVDISRPEDCQFLYAGDVFRMIDSRVTGALLAGCVGDFDGDGIDDVALLMRHLHDGVIVPFVFLARGTGHDVIEIEGIVDPDGFAVDKTVWPGPFCVPRSPDGVFRSLVDSEAVDVIGDLFTVGWRTYFWNPRTGRFDGILTND